MIQSMTGFGKATAAYKTKKINVEIKSLNSKTLDLSTRIAPLYREKEMEIRQYIAKSLERGKIDFSIWIEKDAATDATPINGALVQNYYQQIKKISEETGIPEPTDWYNCLLRLPDVTTKTEVEELTEEEWEEIANALHCLNHHSVPTRAEYIKRISKNPLARKVKMNDLESNMDISRIPNPTEKDFERLERYKKEYNFLLNSYRNQ